MATNQDFDNLITRITVATDTLEDSVLEITTGAETVTEQVVLAQTAATNAQTSATQASASVVQAQTAVTNATTQASNAATSAAEAQQAVNDALALAPFQEAPIDGSTYGRRNGEWEAVGSAEGAVLSVNNVTPDVSGNVTLAIPDEQVNSDWNATTGKAEILNKPTLFSGSYTDLTNKPTIPDSTSDLTNDSGFIGEAPLDGKQYARKSAGWEAVAASGLTHLTDGGFGSEGTFLFNSSNKSINILNYMTAINLASINAATWNGIINGSDTLKYLPAGIYKFTSTSFSSGVLNGRQGFLFCIETVDWSNKGTDRTGAAANKTLLAMSYVVGGTLNWHVWTGANTFVTLT